MKKKFDIKKLLILVMALVMVFALAACGDKDEGPEEPPVEPPVTKTIFDNLFESLSTIGKEEVDTTKNFGGEIDLSLELRIAGEKLKIDAKIKLFVDVVNSNLNGGAATKNADNATAIAIALDIGGIADVGLYYSLGDATNLYITSKALSGGSDVFRFPFDFYLGNTEEDQQAAFANAVMGFINPSDESKMNIWALITEIVDKFGADFSFNSTANTLLNQLGIGSMLGGIDFEEMGLKSIGDKLGLIDTGKLDDDGKKIMEIELSTLLNNLIGIAGWRATNYKNNGGKQIEILPDALWSLAGGVVKGLVNKPDVLGGAIANVLGRPSIVLAYDLDADKNLSELAINIDADKNDANALKLNISITKFEFSNDVKSSDVMPTTATEAAAKLIDFTLDLNLIAEGFKLTFDPANATMNQITSGDASWANFWKGKGTLDAAIAKAVNDLDLTGTHNIKFNVGGLSMVDNTTKGTLTITFKDGSSIQLVITPTEVDVDASTKKIIDDVKVIVNGAKSGNDAKLADIAASYISNIVYNILVSDLDVLDAANAALGTGVNPEETATFNAAKYKIASIQAVLLDRINVTLNDVLVDGSGELNINDIVWDILSADENLKSVFKGDWQALFSELIGGLFAEDAPVKVNAGDEFYVYFKAKDGTVETKKVVVAAGAAAAYLTADQIPAKPADISYGTGDSAVLVYKGVGWSVDTETAITGNIIATPVYNNNWPASTAGNSVSIKAIFDALQGDVLSVKAGESFELKVNNIVAFINKFMGKWAQDDKKAMIFTPNAATNLDFLFTDPQTVAFIDYLLASSEIDTIEELLGGTFTIKIENIKNAAGVKLTIKADYGTGKSITIEATASLKAYVAVV